MHPALEEWHLMTKLSNFRRETVNVCTIMRGLYADIREAITDIQLRYPSIKFPLQSDLNPEGVIVSAFQLRIIPKDNTEKSK